MFLFGQGKFTNVFMKMLSSCSNVKPCYNFKSIFATTSFKYNIYVGFNTLFTSDEMIFHMDWILMCLFGFWEIIHAGHVVSPRCVLPLTEENVEKVLDEVRPGLMADGGNVALHEIDGLVVVLKLQGACGSCPSSTMTLKMGIETRLRDKIPEIMEVEQILDRETGLELNEENVEKVRELITTK